jgi:acetolactate synthase-1/2/3 large subunit
MLSLRYFFFTYRESKVTSGGIGTMGFSLPAAIGAQFGYKERQIICIVGDGGLQMTIQEFGTIMQNKLPIKIFLLNNSFLGMVRQWQELFFSKRYSFTKLINPDFKQVAKSYKIESKTVLDRTMLVKEVKEALEYTKTYFLEVVVEKEDNVFPMITYGSSIDEIRLN